MRRQSAGFARGLILARNMVLAASVAVAGGARLDGSESGVAVGHVAPGFSRVDLAGRQVRLRQYRGHVVLLNFWATWCGPCLVEMPRFVQWQREMDGLRVIGVSMDDDVAPVRTATAKYQVNYPVVMGDAALGEMYGGVYGLPVTLLIDRRGVVRFRHQGEVDAGVVRGEVQALLAKH